MKLGEGRGHVLAALVLWAASVALVARVEVRATLAAAESYVWDLPTGFPEPKVPSDNPMSIDKVALGRRLFVERQLSVDGNFSCASCHDPARAFTDGRARAVGVTGDRHPRSAMSLANIAYSPVLTWANPTASSPSSAKHPVEMGLSGLDAAVLDHLRDAPTYLDAFRRAFPEDGNPVSLHNVTPAMASFERTLLSGGSPYDRFRNNEDPQAISDVARRGEQLFFDERTECFHCHGGFNFTETVDHVGKAFPEIEFFNTGLYNLGGTGRYPTPNQGVIEFSGEASDMGRFKAPTLRNIAVTAPYMHDGSLATLGDVIDHYAAGGRTVPAGPYVGMGSKNPYKSGFVKGFTLTPSEKRDLIAFLESLTDTTFLNDPRFRDPGWR